MSRQNVWRGAWSAVLGVMLAIGLAVPAAAQDAQAAPNQPPAGTQPASEPADLSKLIELREKAERERQQQGGAPGTQPASEEEDDFVGPAYPPASPPRKNGLNGQAAPGVAQVPPATPRAEPPSAPTSQPPVSRATDEGEWFNFDALPWEDVIKYFVERIGKPLMDPDRTLEIGGELTYKSDRKFTKDEAIDELNLILRMCGPGYRFVETEHHIYLVPLTEMPTHIPVKEVFASREEFEKANLRATDYVTVFVQVKDHAARKVQSIFETMVPDYFGLSAQDDSNQLKMVGMVHDIRRILTLMDRVKIDEADPRVMKIFSIETNARDIERMVREMVEFGSPAQQMQLVRDPRSGQMIPRLTGSERSEVRMTADDRTNTIIVLATPDKLREIEDLIQQIDKRPDLEFFTKVTEIKNANANDIAELLTKIFTQEQGQVLLQGQSPQASWQRLMQLQRMAQQQQQRQRRQPQPVPQPQPQPQPQMPMMAATPEDLLGEGLFERAKKTIRIAADDRTNSIIVYANKDGHKRVDELLVEIDRAQPGNFRTIKPQQAKAESLYPIVSQIVQNMGLFAARGRPASVVLDEDNNQFYVLADREEMTQIEQLIKDLDVPTPEGQEHIVELKSIAPSRVAQMIQPMLAPRGPGGQVPSPAQEIRRRMPGALPPATPLSTGGANEAQIIPLDEAQLLIVICSDEEWAKVEGTIKLWDERATSNTPQLHTFPIQEGDPQAIATALNNLYRGGAYTHPVLGRSQLVIQPDGNQILVYGVQPAIDEITPLIAALDHPGGAKTEILPLLYADVTQVAQQAQALFVARAGAARAPTAAGPIIQPEPLTNSLIVQAEPADMEKIKDFAMQMDQKIAAQATEQRFYEMHYAQPQDVANAVQSIFGGASRRGLASQIRAMAAGSQVIVEAPKDKFATIEAFIKELDDPKGREMAIKTFKLPGCDVSSIATMLGNMIRALPPRPDRLQATLIPDATTESIIVSAPEDMIPKIDEMIQPYVLAVEDLALDRKVYPIKTADANYVAAQLQQQLPFQATQKRGQTVASRINISVDSRQNQIILNAPRFVHPMAEELVGVLDREATVEVKQRTVPLTNADARYVVDTLRPIFMEKARREQQNKSYTPMMLTPDAITNAIIAYGGDEADHDLLDQEISRMEASADALEVRPETIELRYADPNQVVQVINAMFGAMRGAQGQSRQQEVQATVSNGMLVVRAPKKKLEEIRKLVADIDAEDKTGLQIKTYPLKVLNAWQVAQQVQLYLGGLGNVQRSGQMKPGAFGEPSTNTLVVIAPADKLDFIDMLIAKLETADGHLTAEARTYVLKNARADQMQQNVDAMLKAKVAEREGDVRKARVQTAVFADGATNRLFVYAPDDYQELAARLIEMIDTPVDSTDIVHIITLENGDAVQMAQSLNQVVTGIRTPTGSPAARSGTAGVRITADAASNSILLAGMPKDLAEVERWIKDLEHKSEVVPELQIFPLKYSNAEDVADTLKGLVSGTGGRGGGRGGALDTVTITPDESGNRLIVTATKRKMRQVEAFVAELDKDASGGAGGLVDSSGRQLYFVDVHRGDASDIAWDVGDLFPSPKKGGPIIDADWFGEYIKVKCRPNEFDRILSAIREFEKRAKVEKKVITRKLYGDSDRLLAYLTERMKEDVIEVERPQEKPRPKTLVEALWADDEEPDAVREKRLREKPSQNSGEVKPAGRVRPFQLGLPVSVALLGDLEAELLEQEPPTPRPSTQPVAQQKPAAAETRGTSDMTVPSPLKKEKTRVVVQPDGTVIISGPEDDVKDVEKVLDLLEEDLDVGEVIRIFKFKYGDVNAAAEVVNIMFNERQVMRMMQQQQPQPQPGQPGQPGQPRQPGQRGERDQEGREQQQTGMMEQFRQMVGGRQPGRSQRAIGGERVRIATDPGHNYLIIKCQQNDLPEIKQLLRELDIPPGEVQIQVFQLVNLDAEETAENIKEVLGISKAQQRRGGAAGGRQPATPGMPGVNPQQQLMEMLQQQLVSVPGVEGGAKVERVEIVPNAVTNALMVSAPPDVMALIEKVIGELEGLQGRDIVGIYHHELKQAKLDDVLPLLQEIFSAAASGGAGGPRMPGARGRSPGTLGPVTVSGDPRTNTVIFTAQAKDKGLIEQQIEKVDIAGAVAEAETYVCKFGDATAIANVVDALYGAGPVGPRQPRGGGAPPSTGHDVRIVADATTNVIVVWAPKDKRELILSKIEELDVGNKRDIREIQLTYADPERLADKLLQMFGGTVPAGGGGERPWWMPGRPQRQRPSPTAGSGVVIIGEKNSKKLLVRAPDTVFAQIQEIVAAMDQPNKQMDIKRFELKYADAQFAVDAIESAKAELISAAGGGGGSIFQPEPEDLPFDPFTAIANPRTNSLTVVGSEQTFVFIEELLKTIDVETPQDQRKDFRVYVLDEADAQAVAQTINDLAAGGGGERARPRQRTTRGRFDPFSWGMSAGTTIASPQGRELNVYAIAEPSTNTLMVYGRPEDLDTIEDLVINKIEDQIRQRRTIATIPVQNVKPTEIVSFISQFLGAPEAQGPGGRGPRGGQTGPRGPTGGPQIIPNDNAKALVVRGSKAEIEEVRELVTRFDNPDLIVQKVLVLAVPLGQDVTRLADDVEKIVNASEQETAAASGRRARQIAVTGNELTHALIVAGDPTLFGLVDSVIKQLGDIHTPNVVTRVIQLRNLSSDDAQRMIDELQGRRGTTGGRGGTINRPAPPSRSPARPTGGAQPRPSGRRGDATWPNRPDGREKRRPARPLAWLSPVVSVLLLSPGFDAALADALLAGDQEPPAASPQRPAAQATKPADKPVALLQEPPATQPAELLAGVSGQLQGEVVVSPIDSKQIIITGDERDLDFIENVLRLMEATAPEALVEVIRLQYAKASVLAPIVQKAIQARIDATTRSPGPQDRFSIAGEGRSNSLIVSASKRIMDDILALVQRLDVEKLDLQGTFVRAKALRHMRASEAVAMVRPTLEKLWAISEVPKDSQPSIEAVDRNNSVLIVGTEKDVKDVESLLEQIDVEIKAEDEQTSFVRADVILIQLQNGQADDIAKILTDLIKAEQDAAQQAASQAGKGPGKPLLKKLRLRLADGRELPELDLERPIRVIAEKGTNSLIVFSTAKNNEALTEIVKVFDTLPVGADTDLKAIALQHASAEQVSKLLQDVFKDKSPLVRPSDGKDQSFPKGVLPPVPPGVAGRGLPYNLVIQHDVRSNTIIVVGRRDAVLLAAGLITELDKPTADLGLRPRVVELKNMPAAALQDKLTKLLEQRAKALGVDKNTARDSAVILPDERSNALVVLATPEMFDIVEELALQLDSADLYRVVDTRFRRLQFADAQKLQGLLKEVFDRKKTADREQSKEAKDSLEAVADVRSNSLILTGTRDYLTEADALLDNLDQQFDPTVVFVVRPIKLNSAANVAALLKDMVDKSLKEQDSKLKGTPIYVASDPLSDSLLLAASQEDMVRLERWVEILDRPSEVGRMTRIIPLRRGSAEDVAKAATDVFKFKGTGAKEIDLTITHEPSTNSVVAFGPAAVLKDIEDFVRRLDETEPGAGTIVKIFKLEQADAEDAGNLLTSILEGRGGAVGGTSRGGAGGGGRGRDELARQVMLLFQREHPEIGVGWEKAMRADIVVISDLRTNSLVVTAPADSMKLMESLVKAIDVPPEAAKVRVFALKNADAEQTVKMLEALFQRKGAAAGAGGRAGQPQTERELTLAEAAGGGRQEVSFTTDVRTNSVIAAGTPGYLDLVEQLILELDTKPIQDFKTLVYSPRNMVAEDLAKAVVDYSDKDKARLKELGKDISLARQQEREIVAIAHKESNRIILSCSPRVESEVLDVVRELDQPPPQVSIEVLILEVTTGNDLQLGVEFAFQDLQYAKAGPQDTNTFDFVGGTDIGAGGSGLGGFTFTITGRDFNFLLRALQSENSLKVLSRPQIVAMDNQEANIEITNDVPFVAGVTVTTGIAQTNVQRQDVGIKLKVKPQINPDGYVRMEIRQEVSDISDSTVAIGQGLTAPIFFKRIAETVVTVKDNETVVLGGLIQSRDSKSEQKIPLVGDIPILGTLFRFQNNQARRSELLVILTPRVVRTIEDYRSLSVEARDQTGLIPVDMKTNPLMRALQVRPEEVVPLNGEGELGPAEQTGSTEKGREGGTEEYGPRPPAHRPPPTEGGDPNSYDVPVSMLTRRG